MNFDGEAGCCSVSCREYLLLLSGTSANSSHDGDLVFHFKLKNQTKKYSHLRNSNLFIYHTTSPMCHVSLKYDSAKTAKNTI